jgi:predicted GNAT family acetyltransferase
MTSNGPAGRLRVDRFADAPSFLDAAEPFLAEREAEHNLILGIAASLLRDPDRPTAPPYLAVVRDRDETVGAAVMTPPFNLVLSCMADRAAIAAVATDLADPPDGLPSPPGVTGPIEIAHAFGRLWGPPRGRAVRKILAERVYRIERLVPPTAVPGRVRLAGLDDRDLLVAWCHAFLLEALGRSDPEDAIGLVERGLQTGTRSFYVWEHDGPASLAGVNGPTPNGIRLGPVYTPPERRGHGYGSAVTAAATQAQFDLGRRFVYLFTDLANPTSNKIYQAIGYQPVIDVDQLAFEGIDSV